MTRTRTTLAALLACFVLAPLTWAWAQQAVVDSSPPARTSGNAPPAAYRTAVSVDDSATDATAVDAHESGGNTSVIVAPRFTAAGATATIEVWLYHEGGGTSTLLGIADVQTATADGLRVVSSRYLCNSPLVFPLWGSTKYDVRVRDVSSGTVDIWAWTVGPKPAHAE